MYIMKQVKQSQQTQKKTTINRMFVNDGLARGKNVKKSGF